jgi:ribosome assembly protein YihI (activator of Der GTPase)
MTRQKKNRKGAPLGPTQKPRVKKPVKAETTGKRIRKHKGHISGNRNNPETTTNEHTNQAPKSTDPRHGSKTPISLNPEQAKEDKVTITDYKPQVVLKKVVELQITPEQELEQIENDGRLMALLEKVDNDELITGKDAKYFNANMARHKELMEELGYEDDEDFDDDEDEDEDADYEDDFGDAAFADEESEDQAAVKGKSLVEQWEDDEDPLDPKNQQQS